MDSKPTGKHERERCIAILDAFRDNLDQGSYLWLWNRMNNPDHDPRCLEPDQMFGYNMVPKKKSQKKKRKP